MCWIPTNKEHRAIAKVAQKDIPIIKIGYSFQQNKFSSFVKLHKYDLQYPTPMVKIEPRSMRTLSRIINYSTDYIAEGYHFYKSNMIKIALFMPYIDTYITIHSRFYKNNLLCLKVDGYFNTICVAKGYIPKGTVYYLNSNGEGVAEQIVITKIVHIKDYLTKPKLSKL